MNGRLALFASLALVPAMVGPLPAAARSLSVALCGGGTLTIPVSGETAPGSPQAPCCAKGCHSGSSRKRLDKSQ